MSQELPRTRNRRAFVRRKSRGTRCRCRKGHMGGGPDLALALIDLSQTGASLLVKVALEPKQPVELELYAVGYNKNYRVEAVVVRCEPTPEGTYLVGVRFERYLTYTELLRIT